MSMHADIFPLRTASAAVVLATLLMTGCAQFPRALVDPSVATSTDASVKAALDEKTSDSLEIDAGYLSDDVFMLRPINERGNVPDRQIKGVTITESGIFDALRLIGKSAGLTLNVEGGINGSERFGSTSAFDVHGSLQDVLEELSETMGFFYSIRKNTLFIQQEQQFVVELPPALNEDNAADLTNTLQFLGAKDTYIDRMSRSLVFKANRKSLTKIETYIKKIRDTRSLIVYDINIFQVDLRDNADTGIQWNQLGWNGTPITSTSSSGTGSPSVAGVVGKSILATKSMLGMGLVLSGTNFTVDSLINFLKTQGSVKAISRPRLAVISGTKGMLRVGQVTTFVSKVGTNFSTSVNQVTTETRDLKTGLELGLFGDFSDNTVYTRVGLNISEIIRLDQVQALGTNFTLPQTADRELNTIVRARPGDMILLGGITIEKNTVNGNSGITGSGKSKEVTRSELVLTLKSKIVYFRGKERKLVDINPAPQTAQLIGVELKPDPTKTVSTPAVTVIAKSPDTPIKITPVGSAGLPVPVSLVTKPADLRQPLIVITSASYADVKAAKVTPTR